MVCKRCLTEFKEFIDGQVKQHSHLDASTWFEWMQRDFYQQFGIKETKGFVVVGEDEA